MIDAKRLSIPFLALQLLSTSSAWIHLTKRTIPSTKIAIVSNCSHQRREVFHIIGSTTMALLIPRPSIAAFVISTREDDKQKLIKGYNRLQYLLENWDAETTICKTGQETTFGDKCERTPLKVMEYLGFKSISDPLFKADATMLRLKDFVPTEKEEDFYEAIDLYSQNAEEANSMAFVSSWGEANPGGGKDRVTLFIERAKKNVIVSRDCLKVVIDIVDF